MKDQHRYYLLGIIILIIVAIVSFSVGAFIQRARGNIVFRSRPGMMGYGNYPRQFGMGMGFNGLRNSTSGQVSNISGDQVTLRMPDGTTRTISLSSSTQYIQMKPGAKSDIKQDETVTITGQTSPDGSTSAQTVRINVQ